MKNVDTVDEKDINLDDPDLGQCVKSFGNSLEMGLQVVHGNTFTQFIFDLDKQKVGQFPKQTKTLEMKKCPSRGTGKLFTEFMKIM